MSQAEVAQLEGGSRLLAMRSLKRHGASRVPGGVARVAEGGVSAHVVP